MYRVHNIQIHTQQLIKKNTPIFKAFQKLELFNTAVTFNEKIFKIKHRIIILI